MSIGPHQQPTARQTALRAIAAVLFKHLGAAEQELREAPLIVQLDGSGHHKMLDELAQQGAAAAPRWTVVRFDAWQHQRLAPPWWWLVSALDKQIRRDTRPDGWRQLPAFAGNRVRDAAWRLMQLLRDLRFAAFAAAAGGLWILVGPSMDDVVKSAAAIVTGVGTLALAIASGLRPLRRRLLLSGPQSGPPVLRSGDPMTDLRRRYAFLLRSTGAPVLVLVDNLDRCQASYVVELLEGMQTLLHHPGATDEKLPFVAFIVAADRDWVCHSFKRKYEDFEHVARRPGRPFGQAFLEKVFDLELRLPAIPAALSMSQRGLTEDEAQEFADATSELRVREIVRDAEAAAAIASGRQQPLQALRIAAVATLGELEIGSRLSVCPVSTQYQCHDTAHVLGDLTRRLDAAAAMIDRLDPAYCVQRTKQLLGGHAIDADPTAIARLALWTILSATWPRLARHLAANPHDIDALRTARGALTGDDDDLSAVFDDRTARQLAAGVNGNMLAASDIIRYARAMEPEPPATAPAPPGTAELAA